MATTYAYAHSGQCKLTAATIELVHNLNWTIALFLKAYASCIGVSRTESLLIGGGGAAEARKDIFDNAAREMIEI